MSGEHRKVNIIIFYLCVSLFLYGSLNSLGGSTIKGWLQILASPSVLITDYIAVGGLAAASLNSGTLVLLYWLLLRLLKTELNGMLLAGFFTVAGFAFFGKNPFNAVPVSLGVLLYARAVKKPGRSFAAPLLFSSTIAPVVSQTAFGFGFGVIGILGGCVLGIVAGFLIAACARHIFGLHEGFNLYNIGTTGGIVGVCIYIFMRGFGLEIKSAFLWSTEHSFSLGLFFSFFLIGLIVIGLLMKGNLQSLKTLTARDGRLPTDTVLLDGSGATLLNMVAVGLLGLGYVVMVGGVINGPVLAGLLTMTGFGALGKNFRNTLPIMIGVYLITIPKIWSHTDPGPLIAALFSTALAPIAGRFGFWAGILAGIVHLPMVMHVGSMHGFMNLYNNGFAGGLAMLLFIAVIKGLKPELLERD